MKTTGTWAFVGLLGVALAVQPAIGQRTGRRPPAMDRMDGASLLLEVARDFDEFSEQIELNDQQRADVRDLLEEFNAEYPEALDRIAALRDSVSGRRLQRRGARGGPTRQLGREYHDMMRDLRPAFAQFRSDLADILTWNQGREVRRAYGWTRVAPGPRDRRAMRRFSGRSRFDRGAWPGPPHRGPGRFRRF